MLDISFIIGDGKSLELASVGYKVSFLGIGLRHMPMTNEFDTLVVQISRRAFGWYLYNACSLEVALMVNVAGVCMQDSD